MFEIITKPGEYTLADQKKLGVKHYVGSTDVANQPMIRVMNTNGALERDRKGIYRLDR